MGQKNLGRDVRINEILANVFTQNFAEFFGVKIDELQTT